jgi:hypothetical protein
MSRTNSTNIATCGNGRDVDVFSPSSLSMRTFHANAVHGHGYYAPPSRSSGIGCLAWMGLFAVVGFALLFSACVACVALAAESGDPSSADTPEPEPSSSLDEPDGGPRVVRAGDQCIDGSRAMDRPLDAKAGKASTLSGRVCAVEIFVSGAGASWTKSARIEQLAQTAQGYAFLRRQAARYGQELDVVEIVEPGDIHIESVHVDPKTGWVDVPLGAVEAKLGRSLAGMLDGGRALHGCKNGHVVLHVTPEATFSHAECGHGAEYAVVAHRDAMVVAHEVLHLYGAWDFYHLDDSPYSPQPRARAAELERLFPADVMGLGREAGTRPDVGALTAWLVGWSRCAKPGYAGYRPM